MRKVYFYQDIRITCYTNHTTLLDMLDMLLGMFPEPTTIRGEATYTLWCYEQSEYFPLSLPESRRRIDAVTLLTGTRLKFYTDLEDTIEYQKFMELSSVHGEVLSVIDKEQHTAHTQLTTLNNYDSTFLRRYVLLLALGTLVRSYGFEPCHAAAISAPWDRQQGMLILGNSGSGKTTLSLGCASIGCGLLGDDLLTLRQDEQHMVSAYSIFPEVSVRSASIQLWSTLSFLQTYPVDTRDKRYCSIEAIRPGATNRSTTIHCIVFPFLTGNRESTLIPLSKARTLQTLVQLCISREGMYPRTQEQLFLLCSLLAEQASGYQCMIARGDLSSPYLVCSLFTGASV
ncbi:MAG: hypothetical protein NVSMB49_12420 [Ktedonobacteraceae bacterium]